MQEAPLMPKATAVWLVENTALSFDQIAEFCKLYVLEVRDRGRRLCAGHQGPRPDPDRPAHPARRSSGWKRITKTRLRLAVRKVRVPEQKTKRGPRYTPVPAARIARMRSCGCCAIIPS